MAKILVIEDDVMLRNTIDKILRHGGFDVVMAEDGIRGMTSFRAERPDLVLTDIIMPEREGIATIVEIRRERPDAKIIAMSGGGRIGSADFLGMAKKLGANDIIPKPFLPQELLRRVRACLGCT